MPLLEGKFDPLRLNAVTVAPLLFRDPATPEIGGYDDLTEELRQPWIDLAQAVLDDLWHMGVIQ